MDVRTFPPSGDHPNVRALKSSVFGDRWRVDAENIPGIADSWHLDEYPEDRPDPAAGVYERPT